MECPLVKYRVTRRVCGGVRLCFQGICLCVLSAEHERGGACAGVVGLCISGESSAVLGLIEQLRGSGGFEEVVTVLRKVECMNLPTGRWRQLGQVVRCCWEDM